jgi:hypothetical protein
VARRFRIDDVLLNLIAARTLAGDLPAALEAGRLLENTTEPLLASMGRAYRQMIESSVEGSVETSIRNLEDLLDGLRARGETHYLGVALSNLAYLRIASGDLHAALASADEAIDVLAMTQAGVELVSARLVRSAALALLGDINASREEGDLATSIAAEGQRVELGLEIGLTRPWSVTVDAHWR